MSNFLNSAFTDLNSLISINADEVRTQNLYVNDVAIYPNSNNFTTINCQELICQNDISSNTIYATTSIQNIPVSTFLYFDPTSSIQTQFNNITSQLSNYITSSNLTSQLSNYVLTSSLNSQLLNYITSSYLTSQLSNYVSNNTLSNQLSNYVSNTTLSNQLSNYCPLSNYNSLKTEADLTTLLLTGGSWDSTYNFLNLTNNLHVFGSFYLGSDSNFCLNQIPYTYVSNSSLNSTLSNYCPLSNYNSLKTQADATTLLLTNTEYISGIGFLNFYNSINVFGKMLVTKNGNYIDVGDTLLNLSTNYITNSYLTSQLSNYVLTTSLNSQLSSYVTTTGLLNLLLDYTLNSDLKSNYVSNSTYNSGISNLQSSINSIQSQSDGNSTIIATNTTAIAGLVTASAAQQTEIDGLLGSVGVLQGEVTTLDGEVATLQAKTALQEVVNTFTQFSGGIKIMNGLVYSSIINNDGSSEFYALMTLHQGLAVTNGILSDRVTTSTDLKSNGTLEVVGNTTLSRTDISGNLTISNGNLTISGTTPNTFNNDCIFNGNIISSNLSISGAIQCNTINFTNNVGNNSMMIGTNGASLLNPNSIYIGNSFSTTYLNGLVLFTGSTFNMSSYINQVGF